MTATINSTNPQSLYQYTGKNFAPLSQFESLSPRSVIKDDLCDELRKVFEKCRWQKVDWWQEQYDIGRMVSNLRTGKLLLIRNAITNGFMFKKRDSRFADRKTVSGIFQFYSDKLTAEWLSSRPELDPVCPSDNDEIETFIDAVKVVQDNYNKKFFTTEYETNESLSAQDYGTWITRYRFDPDVQDIVCELLDFTACKWDQRFTAEESPYFIYESKCMTSILRKLLDRDVPSDGDDNDHYGLQVKEQISTQGGNVRGYGQGRTYGTMEESNFDETVVTQLWLQPEMYCDWHVEMMDETLSGVKLPKGKGLIDVFPTGMVIVGINNMNTILGIYAENHKDHIVSGRYHIQPYTGVGKGISDSIEAKKDLDDLYSQALAFAKSHGTPAWGYDSNAISEDNAKSIMRPRSLVPIDMSTRDGIRGINDVVQALVPGNASRDMFTHIENLKGYLQISMQVTDFTDGLPGVDNKTATGAQIGDANAAMILVPQHLNKADHRKRSAIVIYNLFKRFMDKPKWFSTRGTNHNGITDGIALSGSQFDGVEIDFEIVSNSEVPQNQFEQQKGLGALFQYTGGLMGLLQANQMSPDVTSDILSTFNVKLRIPTTKDIARVCRKRITQGKKILQQEMMTQQLTQAVGIQVDNSQLMEATLSQIYPPIISKEPFFQQKVQWLSEYLDTDEMMFAAPYMRDFICAMIDRHLQEATLGQAQIAQDQSMANIMANLPELVGQQMMTQQTQQLEQQYAQQQQQQEQQQQIMQGQQQLNMDSQKATIAERSANAQRDHEAAMNDVQHQQAMKLEALKQLGALQKPVASAA